MHNIMSIEPISLIHSILKIYKELIMKLTGYSHYRGQNLGRIMHCVATYCDGLRHHETTIDYGEIRFYGRLIARYKWPDETDTPHFEFYDEEGWRNAKLWEYNQFVRKPYLDDYPPNLDYVVQEARKGTEV